MSRRKRLNRLGLSYLKANSKELKKLIIKKLEVIEQKNKKWLNKKETKQ